MTPGFSQEQSLGIGAIKLWFLLGLFHGNCYRRKWLVQSLRKWGGWENNVSVTFYFVHSTHFPFLSTWCWILILICSYVWVRRTQIRSFAVLNIPSQLRGIWNKIVLRGLIIEFWFVTLGGHYGCWLLRWENVLDSIVILREHFRFEHWKLFFQACWLSLRCHGPFIEKKTWNNEKTWHNRKGTGNWALLTAVWLLLILGLCFLIWKAGHTNYFCGRSFSEKMKNN